MKYHLNNGVFILTTCHNPFTIYIHRLDCVAFASGFEQSLAWGPTRKLCGQCKGSHLHKIELNLYFNGK
jgi:hypothetical protein